MAQHLSTSLNEEEKRDLLRWRAIKRRGRAGAEVRNQDSDQGLVELAHKPILALGRLG